jgi:hypothetical protein
MKHLPSICLGALIAALVAFAPAARADRALLSEQYVMAEELPAEQIEGACGLAIAGGRIYVSDYYSHAVDAFTYPGGSFVRQYTADPLDGDCQLAAGTGGALYANDWHGGVSRILPSSLQIDGNNSTGVAVDESTGNVYVDDREYVAVYEPSGEPVLSGGEPLRIGVGTLSDGYGIAADAGRIYVPDAATGTVEVYEPATDSVNPVASIDGGLTPQGGFVSLVDAAIAIDPESGHLVVIDNLQPGYENPEGAIEEFAEDGTFLGQVATHVIDGEPSGIAFGEAGQLLVTSGNDTSSKVFEFGPYVASPAFSAALAGGDESSPVATRTHVAPVATSGESAPSSARAGSRHRGAPRRSAAARARPTAEVVQRNGVRVAFDGWLSPTRLPRSGSAPVRVGVSAKIGSTSPIHPPRLRTMSIAINRYGKFHPGALPACTMRDIQPATTQNALRACRGSLIGHGRFRAKVLLSDQASYPSAGELYAFNGTYEGHPAILAHVYGAKPVPTSFTLPFVLGSKQGTYGSVLRASLPSATGKSSYISEISLDLGKRFRSHGKMRSYLTASCPAPRGFREAAFPFAKASFGFDRHRAIGSVLSRTCAALG